MQINGRDIMKHEKKSGRVAWFAWIAAAIFYLYEYAVRIAPSVMEHELAVEFSASAATMGTVLGAYYLVYAPLQLFAGLLFDRFGGKKVLVPASILVSIGCLCMIIPSNSLLYITAGRILAGVGSSCAFIGVMYLAAVWFHENKLAFLSGLATSLGICGALLGQAPLSVLIDKSGWRMSLVLLAIIGLVTFIIVYLFIPQTPHWEKEKQQIAKSDRSSLANFVAGLISVCRNKQTWIVGLVASCLYMPTVVFGDLWGVQYMRSALGLHKAEAAKVTSMLYIGWLIGGPLIGLLSDLIGCRRKLLVFGCFLSTIFFSVVLICPIQSPFIIGLLLFLAGISSSPQVICFVASLEANLPSAKGSAIAVVNMIVMFVGGIFQPIVGWLMGRNSTYGTEAIPHIAFRNALLTMPILTFVGLLLSLFIKKGIDKRALR
ncbi:MAG: MFS transporter, partial [Puniceicoccales bacterium]|nr:MFS transporter [Puniceicoccales bacterium]